MTFIGEVKSFEEHPIFYASHIPIPEEVYQALEKVCIQKRVVCTLKDEMTFHAAMLPKGDYHYILLNKDRYKKLQLSEGLKIKVNLDKDESEYGINISEEMTEVLFADPDGNFHFQNLTPGKKRSLIHLVNKIANSQKKIEKTFIILEHLKNQKGKLDFQILNEDFKNSRFKR